MSDPVSKHEAREKADAAILDALPNEASIKLKDILELVNSVEEVKSAGCLTERYLRSRLQALRVNGKVLHITTGWKRPNER